MVVRAIKLALPVEEPGPEGLEVNVPIVGAHAQPHELTLKEAGVLVECMGAQEAHLKQEIELVVAEWLHREATHDRGRGVEARPARSCRVLVVGGDNVC